MKGSQVYAIETQLSHRVSEWTNHIEPKLEEEVEHFYKK